MRKIVMLVLGVLITGMTMLAIADEHKTYVFDPENVIWLHELDIIETWVKTDEVEFRYWYDPGKLHKEKNSYCIEMQGKTSDGYEFYFFESPSMGIQCTVKPPNAESTVIFDRNGNRKFSLEEGDEGKPDWSSQIIDKEDASKLAEDISKELNSLYQPWLLLIDKWKEVGQEKGLKELKEAKERAAKENQKGE